MGSNMDCFNISVSYYTSLGVFVSCSMCIASPASMKKINRPL